MSGGEGQDAGGQPQHHKRARLRLVRFTDEPPPPLLMPRAMARTVAAVGLVCIAMAYGGRVLLADVALPGWLLFVNVCGLAMMLLMLLDARSPYRERLTPRDEREQGEWLQTIRLSWQLMLGLLFLLYIASAVARWNGWQPGRHIVTDLLMLITQIAVMLPAAIAAWREPPEVDAD